MKRRYLIGAIPLFVVACGQSEATITTDEIAQSIRVGASAADVKAPYGFGLPEGAKVEVAMLQGTGLTITGAFSLGTLEAFYREEFERLGYTDVAVTQAQNRVSISGKWPDDSNTKMQFSASQSDPSEKEFSLVFLKLGGSR